MLGRTGAEAHSLPFAIVKLGTVPAFLCAGEVAMLARIDVVLHDFPFAGAPGKVSCHHLLSAVGIGENEVHAEGGTVSPGCPLEVPHADGLVIVPSVTQHHTRCIHPSAHE